jgi:hypothetical protein
MAPDGTRSEGTRRHWLTGVLALPKEAMEWQ